MLGRVSKIYDAEYYREHKSCVVCFEEFEDKKSRVTTLPCDVRHYFHTECIQTWTMRNNSCPLCKTAFNVWSLYLFNKNIKKHLQNQKKIEEKEAAKKA